MTGVTPRHRRLQAADDAVRSFCALRASRLRLGYTDTQALAAAQTRAA